MGIGELYQSETDRAWDVIQALPPKVTPAPPKWNGWSAPLRGVAAGGAESGGMLADALKGFGQIMGAAGTDSAGGMFSTQSPKERQQSQEAHEQLVRSGPDTNSEVGRSLRNVARDYRPDPATAGLAERLTFDLTRVVTKAVGYTAAGTPIGGAVGTAVDEGMTVASDLAEEGVDQTTRMKVGAVVGASTGLGVALPVAGRTVAQTVGLVALGGPGAFMAQQKATSEILAEADYTELSKQYDPLDPVGLSIATLVPGLFGAYALRSAARSAVAPKKAAVTTADVDAVMTHNLSLQKDLHDVTPPAEFVRQMDEAVRTVEDARVTEVAPLVDAPTTVARQRMTDTTTGTRFDISGVLDEAQALLKPGARVPDDVSPLLSNVLVGLREAQGNTQQLAAMLDHYTRLAGKAGDDAQPVDLIAEAIEKVRAGEKSPVDVPTDPQARSIQERVMLVEATNPDIPVGQTEDGRPITAREELALIRKEAAEGTDADLGANEAPLLQVAANCALSLGTV